MSILYFDCFSGISGDMALGALIDAGADMDFIESNLKSLDIHGWRMELKPKQSYGIRGSKVNFIINGEHHPHRSFLHIMSIIEKSDLPQPVKKTSVDIFYRLALAEGKVHGKNPEDIHFHEVGAVDSILDIVGTSLALHNLGVSRVFCSPLPPGTGYIKCAHGILPVPAPATAELLIGVPLRKLNVEGELVTPTGAAIAVTLSEGFGIMPEIIVKATGYGLGDKDYGLPNMLRVFIGEEKSIKQSSPEERVLVLETNIDNMNPEIFGYVSQLLFDAGALDVFLTPVYMKKMRPGTVLTVLCNEPELDNIRNIIFRETATLGIRIRVNDRIILKRSFEEITTPYGTVRIKYAWDESGSIIKAAPEYEDCVRAASLNNVPLSDVYNYALCRALQNKNKF